METFRTLRSGLCVYECLRLFFLIGVFVVLEPAGNISFPWLALITPGAMFVLIALFWRLNMQRYRLYAPLYLAGKGLSIITTMFWFFFARNYMMREVFFDSMVLLIVPGIVFFLLLGDVLSAWLASKIMKSQ